jgi:PAS domain S-box-containing protein
MSESNVAKCCVFSFYDKQDNEYVEAAARGRDDLIPFAFINPKLPDAAATLEGLVKKGFRGLKLHPFADGYHLNNFKIVDPLFEVCDHYKIPILCHGLADNAYNTVYAFAEMAGQDDLVGGRLDQLLGDSAWDDISHQRGELLSKQDAHISFEHEFVRRDGRKIWVSIYSRMLRDPSGAARFAVLQVLDFTEQRLAQRALAVSERDGKGSRPQGFSISVNLVWE